MPLANLAVPRDHLPLPSAPSAPVIRWGHDHSGRTFVREVKCAVERIARRLNPARHGFDRWLAEACLVGRRATDCYERTADLFVHYNTWLDRTGRKARLGVTAFCKALDDHGVDAFSAEGGRSCRAPISLGHRWRMMGPPRTPVADWLSRCCDLEAADTDRELVLDLYRSFSAYAYDQRVNLMSLRDFGHALSDKGIRPCGKNSRGQKYRGPIRLTVVGIATAIGTTPAQCVGHSIPARRA